MLVSPQSTGNDLCIEEDLTMKNSAAENKGTPGNTQVSKDTYDEHVTTSGAQRMEDAGNSTPADDPVTKDDHENPDVFSLLNTDDFKIERHTKQQLMGMNKEQLCDGYIQLEVKATDLWKEYCHLSERLRRDTTIKFVFKSDRSKALGIPSEEPAGDPPPSNGGAGEGPSNKGGGGADKGDDGEDEPKKPRRGKDFTKGRDDRIPVLEIEADLSDERKKEIFGDDEYELIKTEALETYRTLPARIYLERTIVYVYKNKKTGKFVRSIYGKDIKFVNNSRVSEDLIARIAYDYYQLCIPLPTLAAQYTEEGCPLKKQDMYRWVATYGNECIALPAAYMRQCVVENYNNIQSDETYIQNLELQKETGQKQSYFWQIRTSELITDKPQIVSYHLVGHRSVEQLQKLLGDFNGNLACDGHSAYSGLVNKEKEEAEKKAKGDKACADNDLDEKALRKMAKDVANRSNIKITITCCGWHIRHYFANCLKGIPGWNKWPDEKKKANPACHLIMILDQIFKEERKLKDLTREERGKMRMSIIDPLVKDFYVKVERYSKAENFDQGSLFGKAITYALNRRPYFEAAVANPDIPLQNAACERSFIHIAKFRNNSKQFVTKRGGASGADYFTVIDTCLAQKKDALAYLTFCMEKMPGIMKEHAEQIAKGDLSFLEDYMPWSENFMRYEAAYHERTKMMFQNFAKAQAVSC